MFFILHDVDIASYADENTPYVIADDINGVIKSIEQTSKPLFEWFENNLLKSNADKCHLLVSSSDAVNLTVSEYDIKNSKCEKLLGVKFDNKLTFEKHISDICRKDVSIHDKNIQCLATEMYKVSNRLSPPIISFCFNDTKSVK